MSHKKAVLFSLSIIFASCGCPKEYYAATAITIRQYYKAPGGNCIVYTAPLETVYYPSGCDAIYSHDSTEVSLRFIRQKINTDFCGAIASTVDRRNNQPANLLVLTGKVKKVTVTGGSSFYFK